MFRRADAPKAKGLNIIIVGCGKVGMSLVEQLSREDHDITVIDRDADTIQTVTNLYDVIGVVGNGASFSTQMEAGVAEADILISVTHSDELNLLCCIHRRGSILIPGGGECIRAGDSVVVVTKHTGLRELVDILA